MRGSVYTSGGQRTGGHRPPITLGGHRLFSLYRPAKLAHITLGKILRGFGGSAPIQHLARDWADARTSNQGQCYKDFSYSVSKTIDTFRWGGLGGAAK